MSASIKDVRFNRAAFIRHFKPWIRPDGTPGDTYLTFKGRAATLADLNEVVELGYPTGGLWILTLDEVFRNYNQAVRVRERSG